MKIAATKALIVNRKSLIVRHLTQVAIFVLTLFTIHYSLFTFAPPVHAQDPCTPTGNLTDQEIINQFNKCVIKNNNFDDKAFIWNSTAGLINALNSQVLGISLLHPETNQLTEGQGALAATSNLVASLYGNPPASGVQYFAQEFQKFNPVQPVYAQTGEGYKALQPVQKLWRVFRDASYVGFVIIFVIIGFMIMFRAHISPQAVATVQDSIPRIVIALILVTFSYAIAGLMIDLMFVVINIVINLLAESGVITTQKASEVIFNKSIFGVIIGGWKDVFTTTAEAIKKLLDSVISGGAVLGLIKWGVGGIAGLIVGIAALFIMFRVFLMLLMAYVTIILLTMIAPFFFLIQALPGNNGAKEWFKQMTANIAVFPAVSLMIIFAGAIGGISAFGGTGAGELQGVGSEALKFPLLVGGLDPGAIGKIIALGFLFMTPTVAQMIKEMIGAKGPQFGGAGVAALGGAAGVAYTGTGARLAVGGVRGAFGAASQASQEWMGARLPGPLGAALRERRAALGIKTGTGGTNP